MKRMERPQPLPTRGPRSWLEERLGVDEIWRALFLRKIPFGVNWFYTLGFVSVALFLVQAITGAVLAMYYSPSPDHAYDSIQYIMTELSFGQVVRAIHHWGASAMVVAVALHMLAVFVMAAYKYPRELTWVVGVVLLLLTMGFGFTGYLLPWDQKAYWATTVGTNMVGTIPELGGILVRVVRGGAELGTLTLTRFYATHVLLLPMIMSVFIGVHLFMVIRQGVSVPPGLWDKASDGVQRAVGASGTWLHDQYRQRYESFKARGHQFFPDLIFEDAIAAVLATLAVMALAVAYGVPLESKADPTDTAYVPRPEWYFMFLFEMLKYFPGSIEWLGAIAIPGVFVVVLLGLPFLDRRPRRAISSRPIAILSAFVVVAAIGFLTLRAYEGTPSSPDIVEQATARLTATELQGRQLAQAQNCSACHVMAGQGSAVGPGLDGIASRRDPAYIHSYIENPKNLNPAAQMPGFIPPLSHEQVENITRYLLALK